MEKFYDFMNRMMFMKRWQPVYPTQDEDAIEQSQPVPMLTHALCAVENKIYGGNVDTDKAVLYALYHEAGAETSYEYQFVEAAEKLAEYMQCLEELHAGNQEFVQTEKTIREGLTDMHMRSVDFFFEHFIPAYSKTLDELDES